MAKDGVVVPTLTVVCCLGEAGGGETEEREDGVNGREETGEQGSEAERQREGGDRIERGERGATAEA